MPLINQLNLMRPLYVSLMEKNWLLSIKQPARGSMIVKMKNFPDGFTLQTMDMWLWSEIVECTQLLVFDQLEAYFKKESATSEDIV